ncbi:hypothetical protein NKI72_22240 [Mesorhizobium sp. M0437]|uniref:hypothetical protein n=1 Tax=Mesorhizobium sp. M0437 TaxID=2956945 RepID=UPI003335542F
MDAFGTIRGRVGYAFDRWLPYVRWRCDGEVKIDEHIFGASESKFQTCYAAPRTADCDRAPDGGGMMKLSTSSPEGMPEMSMANSMRN